MRRRLEPGTDRGKRGEKRSPWLRRTWFISRPVSWRGSARSEVTAINLRVPSDARVMIRSASFTASRKKRRSHCHYYSVGLEGASAADGTRAILRALREGHGKCSGFTVIQIITRWIDNLIT